MARFSRVTWLSAAIYLTLLKFKDMATIIRIDTRRKTAQGFLEYVKTLPFFKIEENEEISPSTLQPFNP